MTKAKKTMKTKQNKAKKAKPAKKKLTKKQKDALNAQRQEMLYDARLMISLMSTLCGGYLAKVAGHCIQTGDNPLAFSSYIKEPLFALFANFEMSMGKVK